MVIELPNGYRRIDVEKAISAACGYFGNCGALTALRDAVLAGKSVKEVEKTYTAWGIEEDALVEDFGSREEAVARAEEWAEDVGAYVIEKTTADLGSKTIWRKDPPKKG